MSNNPDRIVFFDGVCGICNWGIDQLLKWDRNLVLYYAPLQGIESKKRLGETASNALNTIIYMRKEKLYYKSGALLRIVADLGIWQKAILVFLIVPPFLRNALYDFIAKNRYRWFGKKETCRIPTIQERTRFLD